MIFRAKVDRRTKWHRMAVWKRRSGKWEDGILAMQRSRFAGCTVTAVNNHLWFQSVAHYSHMLRTSIASRATYWPLIESEEHTACTTMQTDVVLSVCIARDSGMPMDSISKAHLLAERDACHLVTFRWQSVQIMYRISSRVFTSMHVDFRFVHQSCYMDQFLWPNPAHGSIQPSDNSAVGPNAPKPLVAFAYKINLSLFSLLSYL